MTCLNTLLAIYNSNRSCSVALYHEGQTTCLSHEATRGHSGLLLVTIERLLLQAGLSLSDVQALAYSSGPGSFTSARISSALTQGLALATAIPIIPLSNLQIFAQAAYEQFAYSAVVPCLDAHNQMVYWGLYQCQQNHMMTALVPDSVSTIQGITLTTDVNPVGIGEGWSRYADSITPAIAQSIQRTNACVKVDAAAMIALAREKYHQQAFVDIADALPVYLRHDIAQPQVTARPQIQGYPAS